MTTKLYYLPRVFVTDYLERVDGDRPGHRRLCRIMHNQVEIELDGEALSDLLDDARHYAHVDGPDDCYAGLIQSAKRAVAALEKQSR